MKRFKEKWLILKGERRVAIGDAHKTDDWRIKVVVCGREWNIVSIISIMNENV